MKTFEKLAEGLLLDEDGTLRTAEHCVRAMALVLRQLADAEAEAEEAKDKLSYVLSQGV
jgi:hypothetical protein